MLPCMRPARTISIRVTLAVLAWIVLLASPARVHADGKFFPRHEAVTRDPSMPSQAAVIVHRAGIETLIVESAVESDGSPLAWVLPIPSDPLEIRACGVGAVETALAITAPRPADPKRERAALRWALVGAAILGGFGLLLALAKVRAISSIVLVLLSMAIVIAVLLPALGTARGLGAPTTAGVEHLRTVQAGLYEVDVVRASDAKELVGWLDARGFALGSDALPVIERAIADGWAFCAARVDLAAGVRAPHPLLVRFTSDRVIYPMALTAVGGGMLDLDLVVLSTGPARSDRLDVWCERVMQSEPDVHSYPLWRLPMRPRYFGHPDLAELAREFSDDFWVTRLHGRLDLATHRDDIELAILPPEEARGGQGFTVTLASPTDAALRVLRVAAWALGAAAVIGVPVWASKRPWAALSAALVAAAAVGGLSGFGLFRDLRVANFTLVDSGSKQRPWDAAETGRLAANAEEARAAMIRAMGFAPDATARETGEGADRPFAWRVLPLENGAFDIEVMDQAGEPWRIASWSGRPAYGWGRSINAR
jgi:hypothetical protein